MITVQEEEGVRHLIPFKTDWQIKDTTGIHETVVARIRRMLDLVSRLPKSTVKKIQKLLLLRIPIEAIELRIRVHRDSILAVRGYYYLHNRRIQDGCSCPTCGRTELERIKEIMEAMNGEKD